MAYTTPTAADFKARFPEFTAVADALINLIIAEQEPQVGVTWIERDRVPALMFLVAHILTVQGEPQRTIAGGATGAVPGVVKRRKVGDVETEYQNANERLGTGSGVNAVGAAGYELTNYGRMFKTYLRRNFVAIAAV